MVENGANNKIGAFLKFGDSCKDVATNSSSILDKNFCVTPASIKDNIHQPKSVCNFHFVKFKAAFVSRLSRNKKSLFMI
ncbi:hypothetical protein RYX36_017119 [Vicia faba]